MQLISQTTTDGIVERHLLHGNVPGILWTAVGAPAGRPLVLLVHGGGQDKTAPGIVGRARRYVPAHDFSVLALDAPGHGDRSDEQLGAELAAQAVPEWRAVLDALQHPDWLGSYGPVGLFGVSLGGAIGLPLVAAEPRITAAVLGLIGYESAGPLARQVGVPVEFLMQWDDELVPRESALALFDALGSTEKTLHANPGPHVAVPVHERESTERFLVRHLTG